MKFSSSSLGSTKEIPGGAERRAPIVCFQFKRLPDQPRFLQLTPLHERSRTQTVNTAVCDLEPNLDIGPDRPKLMSPISWE